MAWLALLCGIALWGSARIGRAATDEDAPTSSSSRSSASRTSTTSRSTRASETGREARIEEKLDQILANQDRMFAKLDEVMEELKIVKIRATVR
jgi:hypothetical protein